MRKLLLILCLGDSAMDLQMQIKIAIWNHLDASFFFWPFARLMSSTHSIRLVQGRPLGPSC